MAFSESPFCCQIRPMLLWGRAYLYRRLIGGQRLVELALFKMHGPDVDQGFHGMRVNLQTSFQRLHGLGGSAGLAVDQGQMVMGHDIVREFKAFLLKFFNDLGQVFLLGRHRGILVLQNG